MKKVLSHDEMNRKCEMLETLGFKIMHLDEVVMVDCIEVDFRGIESHFQRLNYHALVSMYNSGYGRGVERIRQDMRSALGLNEKVEA